MTALLTALVLSQAGGAAAQTSNPSAGLISKMLTHYYQAKTAHGTIRLTQTAAGKSIIVDTVLAFERPSKFRLDQQMTGGEVRSTSNVSDGIRFGYQPPENLPLAPKQLYEFVAIPGRDPLTVGEMFRTTTATLVDPSPVLQAIVGRSDDMRYFAGQFATLKDNGMMKVRGIDVHAISGDWRELPERPVGGSYELYIKDDGTLVRYVLKQVFGVPKDAGQRIGVPNAPQGPIQVTSIWDVDLDLATPPAAELFKIRT